MRWVLVLLGLMMADPAAADTLNLRSGELTVTHVASLPEGRIFELGGEKAAIGWLHREYSLFDAPFAVFDERGWVLYRQEGLRRNYVMLDPARLAELERAAGGDWTSHPPLTLWQRHGGALAVALLAVLAAYRLTWRSPETPIAKRPPPRLTRQAASGSQARSLTGRWTMADATPSAMPIHQMRS